MIINIPSSVNPILLGMLVSWEKPPHFLYPFVGLLDYALKKLRNILER